ncbi:hypothetical protein [Streptomyces sp. DSM 15324]|uniref:hypothetical protein n=1 Tax=Streptomyces sp. DSM 15324 TaxID=1739111 RepID=UPI000749AE25|nr:hypothetical protein [Streptomyces sp. DSM 15324]KUO07672.1 hypothetical protein AQJ58_34720 [Streptomyces sp. DSM 15324]
MLALRLTRSAHPAVQARRLLVAAASAATGFLLLSTLGHALTHPEGSPGSLLRLAWCAVPLAATVHLALAVARTDPGTRPRPGLAAIGLGPARLMAVSATTTALSTLLGSMLALLVFLHLRGDLTGMPFDGAATDFLAADHPLPLPAALTLLSLVPATTSASVALMLCPRDTLVAARRASGILRAGPPRESAGRRIAGAAPVGAGATGPTPDGAGPATDGTGPTPDRTRPLPDGTGPTPDRTRPTPDRTGPLPDGTADVPGRPPHPTALPWGAALLATGLAVEGYASRTPTAAALPLPTGLPTAPTAVLLGWCLTAIGLALAGPGLTHLCGRLLQTARPGALRLLAGRGLMQEAARIGRPLGVVCAVASGAYAVAALYDPADPSSGPLTTLGAAVVACCTVATLLTTAVEARQARADTTAALLRLGAPGKILRTAAVLRAAALLSLFAPLTLMVAELASLPLAH